MAKGGSVVTALNLHHRQPAQLAIGPVVAFATFSVAAIRALLASAGQAGGHPSFDQIVLRVQWPLLILLALVLALPAGLVSLLEAGGEPRAASRSPLLTGLALVAALGAIALAYLLGPGLLEIA
jgi:hypothetical protein